ncbi:hypothetical protein [Actinoplanes sp. G11-F43]|uniref:hypothetical protein n=1 Tax=Actinoplanes sp. G11-F43 TaxID=3424130 RepID=UPI003D32E7E1
MAKFTKRTVVVAGVTALALSGGAAWAAITGWNINGTGEANGKAAEIKELTASTTFSDSLFPGAKSPLVTNMTNPNEFPVKLTGQIQVDNATVTPENNDCKTALLQAGMFNTTFPGTPEIGAGLTKSVPGNVTIGNIPQACASKTIKIDYSFKAESLPES